MGPKHCHNIADLRRAAQRRLPAPMFHYIDGGSDDEWTIARNTSAFDDYQLLPEVLRDVSTIDLSTDIFGQRCDLPFFLAPTGMSRLFHHGKELAVARAAERFGTFYSLSTLGTTSLEEIAQTISTPKMFQVYILKDRGLTLEFVERCKAAGYEALCLTVDMAMAGNRERDLRTGMVMPPKFGLKSLWSFATHPYWAMNMALHPDFKLANVVHRVDALGGGAMGLIDYVNSQFDRTVTWKDVEWLRAQWDGPLVIKGVMSPGDAQKAASIGADALMISNHGGRQLDGCPAPVDMVRPFRNAVGDSVQLVVDGGIRRGKDVVKALALGADACSFGKAYLYGLASGGQQGVERALDLLKTEVSRTMTLLGCASITDISEHHIIDLQTKGFE
ncbi:alpha-hydroxy acid oxidase [Erythrobacter aureus]|uniref:Alpha-hydroxy-acid oxidizing protein n=1 Tax=Erythrobacter aureus TaxID=2182384 RepID=A0A345YB13_9SPHN|nr:alpha-hydroxy acid oxidase [Erythrobacter aureus]AXK41115.1 alpha-hydroxy-acid oxidizing protein [Erythrobacter aureus]